MKMHTIVVAVALTAPVPLAASAQTVDQLVKNHALLNAELDRCKQLGMVSVDDARCKTARGAENKRFFENGQTTYKPSTPANIFPSHPTIDPQPNAQKLKPSGPPNG